MAMVVIKNRGDKDADIPRGMCEDVKSVLTLVFLPDT